MEANLRVVLLLFVSAHHLGICNGQTGVCYRSVSSSVSTVTYSRVSMLSSYTCGWLSTCQRTTYRQVSHLTYRTVYSQRFECCNGYQQVGSTCNPVCSSDCSNGGTCSAPNTCSCATGWTGDTCQTASCSPECSNGGTCTGPNTCSCVTGWTGNACQTAICSSECSNGGTCTAPDTCSCPSGWTGDTCQTPICSQECSNGGTCTAPDTCSCVPGWTGNTCQTDIDECGADVDNCEQVCSNTAGSFQCSCNPGYSLASNGFSCNDIDECQISNGGCDHICTNNVGSFQCSCRPGYTLGSDGASCTDIDECQSNNGGCEQVCTNTAGARECSCNEGYSLDSNNMGCTDINECQSANGGCGHICMNSDGSFACSCRQGYTLSSDGFSCTDIDECQSNNGGCEHACFNTAGSFTCDCRPGYALATDGSGCVDTNECLVNNGGCQHICTNSNGSFECSCLPGYMLNIDGLQCNDINECQNNRGGCEHNCTNTVGSFTCACLPGYSLNNNGLNCTDIDECQVSNGGCDHTCTNTAGSFQCSCRPGYTLGGDGASCADVDECMSGDRGGCEQDCTNQIGSYTCSCQEGYALGNNGFSCTDIDECQNNMASCQHNCTNTVGSFQCSCPAQYALDNDGISCNVAVPSLAPTVTGLQRTSATSARISWDPIPHQYRNGDLIAYHLSYRTAANGSCDVVSGDQQTTLISSSDSVGFLTSLDLLQEYCVKLAGATAHGVGVFGRDWKVPLFDNKLFQVRFSGITSCSEWKAVDSADKAEHFEELFTELIDSLCSCTTTGYVGNMMMTCDDAFPNEVVIQGRIVSTPTVASTQMTNLLQGYVLDQPSSIMYQDQALTYSQRCSVSLENLGDTNCDPIEAVPTTVSSETDKATDVPPVELPYALIGGAAGGGVALIVIIICVIAIVTAICKKIRKNRKANFVDSLDMKPKTIDIFDVKMVDEEPLYDTIDVIENPYRRGPGNNQLLPPVPQVAGGSTSGKTEYYMNDGCEPEGEQYEDMSSGYGRTSKVYTYNYVSSGNRLPKKKVDQLSRHTSTKAKEEKKEAKISKDEEPLTTQQTEEYVEMTTGDDGTQTPQDYEVPTIAYL